MKDLYSSIEDYNPGKKRNVLILFDDMISDTTSNKKLHSAVNDLFIRDQKLDISLVFIMQSYFTVPKDVGLNATHFFRRVSSKNFTQ